MYLGDIKVKMRGYTRKDQARYVEVKQELYIMGEKTMYRL